MAYLPRGKPFTGGDDPRRNAGGRLPDGRTKDGETLMDVLKAKMTFEKIAGAIDKLVAAGDPKAALYMVDRHLGRPAQAIHVSGDQDKPLHMLVGVEGRNLAPRLAPGEDVIEAESILDAGNEDAGDGAVRYLE